MAPKKDVPSVTAATVAAGLAVPEPNQKQAALLQLAGPSFSTSQAISDIVQQGIPDKLVELVQYTDKSVKLLACRQVATYAAAGPEHPLKQAVASVETTEVRLTADPCLLHTTNPNMQLCCPTHGARMASFRA